MKKEWFFDCYCGQQYAALQEDGKLTEFAAEKIGETEIVGNIYKGRVMNVLSGMQAAFVNCGLGRNCYLSMDSSDESYTKYDGVLGTNSDESTLKVGDEIVVQVVKPPRGNKGAKITVHLSFVGKNIIYLPNTDFIGISRKISDEKIREKMLDIAEKMREKDSEGYIMRTRAPYAVKKSLKKELEYLKDLAKITAEKAKNAKVGELLYEEGDLAARIMRDYIDEEVDIIHVGDKKLYEKCIELALHRGDISEKKVSLYTGGRSMMRAYGIDKLVFEVAQPVVNLTGGGYLVIDRTEAMTVVDVNTGSYIGETDSREDTVFRVNMEAAEEIARQVRLRNIGGIVVVDFIDMSDLSHRESITRTLESCLSMDKAKCRVLPMSDLCVSEFTRKRVGNEVLSYLVKSCESCHARGYVPADVFVVARIRSDIMDLFLNGYNAAIIELNDKVMKKILSEGLLSREMNTIWKDKSIYCIPHKTFAGEQYTIYGDNSGVLNLPDKAQILY